MHFACFPSSICIELIKFSLRVKVPRVNVKLRRREALWQHSPNQYTTN